MLLLTHAQNMGVRTLPPGHLEFSPPLHSTLPFSLV